MPVRPASNAESSTIPSYLPNTIFIYWCTPLNCTREFEEQVLRATATIRGLGRVNQIEYDALARSLATLFPRNAAMETQLRLPDVSDQARLAPTCISLDMAHELMEACDQLTEASGMPHLPYLSRFCNYAVRIGYPTRNYTRSRAIIAGSISIYSSDIFPSATETYVQEVRDMTTRIAAMSTPLTPDQADSLRAELSALCAPDAPLDSTISDAGRRRGAAQVESARWSLPTNVAEDLRHVIEDITFASAMRFEVRGGPLDPRAEDDDYDSEVTVDLDAGTGWLYSPDEESDPDAESDEEEDEEEEEAYNEATYHNLVAAAAQDMRRYLNLYESEDLRIIREEAEEDEANMLESEGWETMFLTPEAAAEFRERSGRRTMYGGAVAVRRGPRQPRSPPVHRAFRRIAHLESDSDSE